MLPMGHLCSGGINQRAAVGMGPPRFSSEGPHRHTAAQGGDPQVSPAAAPTTAPANWLATPPPPPFHLSWEQCQSHLLPPASRFRELTALSWRGSC